MSDSISKEIRRLVFARAEGLCEYCHLHVDDTFFGCEVDHIISRKHGGLIDMENMALACVFCNRHKGTDIASLLRGSGELIRWFHPRKDRWSDHFRLNGSLTSPLTPIDEVTANLLQFNNEDRLLERRLLVAIGRYPSLVAVRRIMG